MKDSEMFQGSLLIEVVLFYKNMSKYLNASLPKESNLNLQEVFFLLFIDNIESDEDLTYYNLIKTLPFDRSYINKIIQRLEEKGCVERMEEGRRKRIVITSLMKDQMLKIPKHRRELADLLVSKGVTIEEVNTFMTLMKKISSAIE